MRSLDTVRKTSKWLRQEFSVPWRVVVRVVPLDNDCDGECWSYANSYKILINSSLSEGEQIETLIHEWAHVLTRPKFRERQVYHTHSWQRALGKIHAARERYHGNP